MIISQYAKRQANQYNQDKYYMEAVIRWRKANGIDETDPVQTWPTQETLIEWLVKQLPDD
jgi:hypothetical protein